MNTEFSLKGYRQMLEYLESCGYTARNSDDAEVGERHMLLRHDLDMSIDAALPIAEIERDMGISATYFVMVRNEFYNPFSKRSLDGLQRLIDLDHTLGLHLDISQYGEDWHTVDISAERECAVLEALIERPVDLISFHRPPQRVLGLSRLIAGRHHAYEPRYFQEFGYCSDSKGEWQYGNPTNHESVKEGRALQLLTHPIWWDANFGENVREKLDRFALRRFDMFRAELARNCQAYPQEFRALDPGTSQI